MQFTRLRLAGFKSFVEATELLIEPGLTGVVGPNGCGKSNIVEALRWVMGETSAKQLRGDEMDDVIFGGTTERPARNIAEVSLNIDNSERRAPASFNESSEIEVIRRIERGEGSTYAVNGHEARARDVHTLFADAASGARSAALVSQGRIGALIAAKPAERRHLLEEAAGIAGLHARRHEAELRLRAADANLERLDDVIAALDEQLRALKRQARQATRYRNLSGHIRRAEAILLHLGWTEATQEREAAATAFARAEEEVAEAARMLAEASRDQVEAAAALPGLRQEEAEAAARLHRLEVARDALEAESERVAAGLREAEERLRQIDADSEREAARQRESADEVARLEEEAAALEQASQGAEAAGAAASRDLEEARDAVRTLQEAADRITREVAAGEARLTALDRRMAEIAQRRDRLGREFADAETQREAVRSESPDPDTLRSAHDAAEAARQALEAARLRLEEAEAARGAAQASEAELRETFQSAEAATARVRAEEEALAALVGVVDPELWPPMLDALQVEPGHEVALGAALGDDLAAPSDEAAPVHWCTLPPFDDAPPLPEGAAPLSRSVAAPPALARRLAQIGVVESAEAARRLVSALRQGQRLVTRDGGVWRWDGYVVAEGAQTAAATRMAQRNRHDELRAERTRLEASERDARDALDAAHAESVAAALAERAARQSVWDADRAFQQARDHEAAASAGASEAKSRLDALTDTLTRLSSELSELDETERALGLERAELDGLDASRAGAARLQDELVEKREALAVCQTAHDRLAREAEIRADRRTAISSELARWRGGAENAAAQIALLAERRNTTEVERAGLEAKPSEIAEKRTALFAEIDGVAQLRRDAADRLARAESRQAETDQTVKRRQDALAELREERIRREAAVERADQALATIAERVAERLDCRPEEALSVAGIDPDEALPAQDEVETRLARLVRERENMGAVNLLAEQEAAELDERIVGLQTEREDLISAISKLRHGINSLNREGRDRLLEAFTRVNGHFGELFHKLFGGGRAHLALVDTEDPLEAGLEIMASPPGKRLQTMSLLSGGEQALTAIALIFAVFMTNPAPICVLDEVDAPLDDNNVDRFCTLLADMADTLDTRFLLVTHHRLTMARVDRLYGVTMVERGVSQLVSVDLQTAEGLREIA